VAAQQQALEGHGVPVVALAYLPNAARQLASGDEGGAVRARGWAVHARAHSVSARMGGS
jgi:hypothetical protein